ncbi:MAG: hypothetical protein KatS3mg111_1407 [Pirellulaceae bacterium]|nr:MAG: hypothetical protein KatS3mg111_1407 [Pirellulaceae bacterium]
MTVQRSMGNRWMSLRSSSQEYAQKSGLTSPIVGAYHLLHGDFRIRINDDGDILVHFANTLKSSRQFSEVAQAASVDRDGHLAILPSDPHDHLFDPLFRRVWEVVLRRRYQLRAQTR